jgi:hypothetical protein
MEALEDLERVTAELDGRRVELVLRAPTAGYELPILPTANAPITGEVRRDRTGLVVAGMIQSLDGAPLARDLRRALVASPTSVASLLRLRASFYDDVRQAGRVSLRCPSCGTEEELALAVIALALGASPWPVADGDGVPIAPSLSQLRALGARPPSPPPAAGARLSLPSARLGRTSTFVEAELGAPITAERDAGAWRSLAAADAPFDPRRAHWTWSNEGFRAILRCTLALSRLDEARDLTPDSIERLSMPDFLFIDAAHHLLRLTDVHRADASIACSRCATRFLVVL